MTLDQAAVALLGASKLQRRGAHALQEAVRKESSRAAAATDADVAMLRRALCKTFGNFTRAFGALKVAAHTSGKLSRNGDRLALGRTRLSADEFEWCLTCYLKYCDRSMSRRLFAALDVDGSGDVGLKELAQPTGASSGLMSLVEFRALLLQRHQTLPSAFKEMEDFLQMEKGLHNMGSGYQVKRSLRSAEFARAVRLFDLDASQADHLFSIIDKDGDGFLTLAEFMDALTRMPSDVLMHDFRQRLLARHSSVQGAFEEIIGRSAVTPRVLSAEAGESLGVQLGHAARLRKGAFQQAMIRLGICDIEAAELFRIVDEDGSGDVSLAELRAAVREAAPPVDFDGFWQRFAAEWPEIQAAACETGGPKPHACALLGGVVPLRRCGRPQGAWRPELTGGGADLLLELTADGFDHVAARLDISRKDAVWIFERIVKSSPRAVEGELAPKSSGAQPASGGASSDEPSTCYAQDFLDQLALWTGGPAASSEPAAAARAQVSALKAELASPVPTKCGFQDDSNPPERGSRRKSLPKAPWRPNSAAARSMTPVFVAF